jgi:DNA gyrase subunit A
MADEQNPQLPLGGGDGQGPGAANVQPINIEEEMRRSYLDYSMSVIIGRALPDVRDGLKPVHRRILYAMHDMGVFHNRKTIKCAGVVGELLKKYHPHGDGAVYDALVRLAQPWNMRYPLVDGQGNFGSIDGDSAAAYRYTECRMTAIAEEMLADIDKESVDFVSNFDDTTVEPTVLPTKIPNLLINGSNGIAVGMATNIPPHNLTEIVDATIKLVNNPLTPLSEILQIVQGPDFPTAAFIHGRSGIQEAYRTGRGRFIMRAKAAIENLTKDRQAIIVTEIPYQVNKRHLIERIAELVNGKTIDDVSDIRDESDREGMRIVIELKRGAMPQVVLNQLFKHTQMQESFSMIFLAVVHGQPREMGLIPAIQHFIDHRVDVVRRRTSFLLAKAREREHILEGYRIALDNLDAVIKLVRASASRGEAKEALLAARFRIVDKLMAERLGANGPLTAKQADAILDLQLYRLTRLSTEEILNELSDIRGRIAEYESILASEKKLRGVIVKELEEIGKEYGDARRTIIEDDAAEIRLEDLITDEQVAVTVTHSGYMKRTPISTYRQQRRGGTGRRGMSTREEDFVEHLFMASTHDYFLIFTNTGRVYWLKVYEIPDVGAAGKGKHMGNLVALQPGEAVRAMLNVRNLEDENRYVFFATKNGTVKKTPLVDFSNVMSRGINAIKIEKDDELVAAGLTDGDQVIFLATHDGLAIRFEEWYDDRAERPTGVRPMGRDAHGVRGIDLGLGDYVVGMAITPKAAKKRTAAGAAAREAEASARAEKNGRKNGKSGEGHDFSRAEKRAQEDAALAAEGEEIKDLVLSVTENGYGKRTPVDEYRLQSRGGKGVINVKTTSRNGKVVSIMLVDEDSEVMVISQFGQIIRMDSKGIRESGRSAQGVRLLSLDEGDRVAAAVAIPPEEKDENGMLLQ